MSRLHVYIYICFPVIFGICIPQKHQIEITIKKLSKISRRNIYIYIRNLDIFIKRIRNKLKHTFFVRIYILCTLHRPNPGSADLFPFSAGLRSSSNIAQTNCCNCHVQQSHAMHHHSRAVGGFWEALKDKFAFMGFSWFRCTRNASLKLTQPRLCRLVSILSRVKVIFEHCTNELLQLPRSTSACNAPPHPHYGALGKAHEKLKICWGCSGTSVYALNFTGSFAAVIRRRPGFLYLAADWAEARLPRDCIVSISQYLLVKSKDGPECRRTCGVKRPGFRPDSLKSPGKVAHTAPGSAEKS